MFYKFFKKINAFKRTIFIVEDNDVYAKSIKTFIQIHFPDVEEIKVFHIGEMCLLEMNRNPSIVIMDYFLNSKYTEAHNGLEIIKRIKAAKPKTEIIVLSIQNDFHVVLETIKQYDCFYIQKDREAFNNLAKSIKEIFSRHTSYVS